MVGTPGLSGFAAIGALLAVATATVAFGGGSAGTQAVTQAACPQGAVLAVIGGKRMCLKAGLRCAMKYQAQYRQHGFSCVNGSLAALRLNPRISVTGPGQVVYDWSRDRCDELDIPDLPARAFRDGDGNVELIQAHFENRRLVGPDLDHLTHECTQILNSDHNADPAAFDDNEWISSTWTPDGRTIYALVHDEYHGYEHSGQCPSGDVSRCSYTNVTGAVSIDGGRSYADAVGNRRTVATLPFRYDPNVSGE